jgi:hypothetical protein
MLLWTRWQTLGFHKTRIICWLLDCQLFQESSCSTESVVVLLQYDPVTFDSRFVESESRVRTRFATNVPMHSTGKSCNARGSCCSEAPSSSTQQVSTAGQRCATVPTFFGKNAYQRVGTRATICQTAFLFKFMKRQFLNCKIGVSVAARSVQWPGLDGLDNRGIVVWFPIGVRPAFYSAGTGSTVAGV